jgi:hypothetical protein
MGHFTEFHLCWLGGVWSSQQLELAVSRMQKCTAFRRMSVHCQVSTGRDGSVTYVILSVSFGQNVSMRREYHIKKETSQVRENN